jgi:hypothetical protein
MPPKFKFNGGRELSATSERSGPLASSQIIGLGLPSIYRKEKIMRRMLLSAAAALAVLTAVPAMSIAADHSPTHNYQAAESQENVMVLHQSEQAGATNSCTPQYEVLWSHVKWLNSCGAGVPSQQVQP